MNNQERKNMNQDTKIFASIVDNVTKKQIDDLSNSDAYKGCAIRVMPDCHAGAGCRYITTSELNREYRRLRVKNAESLKGMLKEMIEV